MSSGQIQPAETSSSTEIVKGLRNNLLYGSVLKA